MRNHLHRRLAQMAGGLLMLFLGTAQGTAAGPLILKIGIQGVFSGELASYGDRQKGGITFALSKAGDIVVAGQPLKIELVYVDDQGSAEKGPIAAQQLIDARVNVVIGPGFSGPTASALPLFKQAKIPAVSPFTSADNLATIGGGWYFRVSSRSSCQGEVLSSLAKAFHAEKAVIVDDNEAYGTDISKSVAKDLVGVGIKVVGQYHGSRGITDWSPVIQRLRQDEPDIVIYDGYHTEGGRLFQQARDRGVTVRFLGSDGIADPGIVKVADPAKLTKVGAIRMIPTEFVEGSTSEAFRQFEAEYPRFAESQHLSLTAVDTYVINSFDATNVLLDAVKRAGSVDGSAIAGALRATSFVGMTGAFKYDANGERASCRSTYFEFDGQSFKPVLKPGG
jgi:branched-chain amino acid transport system substrate-binding protein